MRYHINSIKFEEFLEKANNYLERINKQIEVMKDLINRLKWQGQAYEAALIKYNNLIKELETFAYTINLYIKFMETVLEKYGEGNDEIMKSFKKVVEELEKELELERAKDEISKNEI